MYCSKGFQPIALTNKEDENVSETICASDYQRKCGILETENPADPI
jgi:hypothetical protein